jgi:hypothetical protein
MVSHSTDNVLSVGVTDEPSRGTDLRRGFNDQVRPAARMILYYSFRHEHNNLKRFGACDLVLADRRRYGELVSESDDIRE